MSDKTRHHRRTLAQGQVIQGEAAANIALGKCEDDQVAYDASQAAALKTRAAAQRAQA